MNKLFRCVKCLFTLFYFFNPVHHTIYNQLRQDPHIVAPQHDTFTGILRPTYRA